jgi:hypothetical protein
VFFITDAFPFRRCVPSRKGYTTAQPIFNKTIEFFDEKKVRSLGSGPRGVEFTAKDCGSDGRGGLETEIDGCLGRSEVGRVSHSVVPLDASESKPA